MRKHSGHGAPEKEPCRLFIFFNEDNPKTMPSDLRSVFENKMPCA
jgi:hypothetical protein